MIKNIFFLGMIIIFTSCNINRKTQDKIVFEDYSLLNLQGIKPVSEPKKTNKFVEITKNKSQLIYHFSVTDSTIINIFETKDIRLFEFKKTDLKYEILYSYLVVDKIKNKFKSYDFPDNTITADSLINCFVSNFDLAVSSNYTATFKEKDTTDFKDKLISQKDISEETRTSFFAEKKSFNGNLLQFLNY